MYIGIDLGTSALKGILLGEDGALLRSASATYPVYYPKEGYSEQSPEDWYVACLEVVRKLSEGYEDKIKGMAIAGQMHGLVILDENDMVIRPAILWNDGRTEKETKYLNETIGQDVLLKETANIAFAGFTAPKILWLKENEPENFKRIRKIMLPKDYLIYRLTGIHATDYSDASGMLLLDVKNKKWSKKMCEICGVNVEMLPKLYESYEAVGPIKECFHRPNCVMAAGAGDNAGAAIGAGAIEDGTCNLSLGTSGTIFLPSKEFIPSKSPAIHCFAHSSGNYHLMGCILSAASCNKWWLEDILGSKDYAGAVHGTKLGENHVYFLPYLMGERSPHNDVDARGAFIGLRLDTKKEDMSLAVLEGVSFALRDCLEEARAGGLVVNKATVCGGGAKSEKWCKMLASILHVDIYRLEMEEGPSFGAALLAMVASGYLASVEETKKFVKTHLVASPEKDLEKRYDAKYAVWHDLYPTLKASFKAMRKAEFPSRP